MNENLPFTSETLQDPAFRKALRQDARKALEEYGWQYLPDQEIRVVTSPKDCFYVVMPPNVLSLNDTTIGQIQAAGQTASTGGTVGTLGCASSAGTGPETTASTFLCVSSASSLGTTGTAS